jgi:hypothetical protein
MSRPWGVVVPSSIRETSTPPKKTPVYRKRLMVEWPGFSNARRQPLRGCDRYPLLDAGCRPVTIEGMADDYERGYADGYVDGFVKGSLERHHVPESFPGDDNPYVRALRFTLLDLEDENARLIVKLRGYVLAGSAKGPVKLAHAGTASATARRTSRDIAIRSCSIRLVLGNAPRDGCASRIGPCAYHQKSAKPAGICSTRAGEIET